MHVSKNCGEAAAASSSASSQLQHVRLPASNSKKGQCELQFNQYMFDQPSAINLSGSMSGSDFLFSSPLAPFNIQQGDQLCYAFTYGLQGTNQCTSNICTLSSVSAAAAAPMFHSGN